MSLTKFKPKWQDEASRKNCLLVCLCLQSQWFIFVQKISLNVAGNFVIPFGSLSNESYELNFYLRLILGPIHQNQVMESDPVNPHHGTQMDQLIFIM